jgi:hypothetical protein
MGADVTTKNTETTATPEETELNRLQLERVRAAQSGQIGIQDAALDIGTSLLRGEELPGFLAGLPGGLDEESISNMVGRSLEDVAFSSQALGVLDAGQTQEIGVKTAADVRANAAQFNIQNLSQLLNLAVGGQAGIQAPLQAQSNSLGAQLAGLRSTSTRLAQPNPFLQSFQTTLGKTAGSFGGTNEFAKDFFGTA